MLLGRHSGRDDVPFFQIDKETLKVMEDAEPFTSEDNQLSWTPDEDYDSSLEDGTRGMRHVPFCSDGQFVYCLVRHYRERYGEGLVR